MTTLDIKPKVEKFLKTLPKKHKKQLIEYILSFEDNPHPHDARPLKGIEPYLRVDVGEYRIIYRYESSKDLVMIVLIGKRNDDEVYRIAKRLFT